MEWMQQFLADFIKENTPVVVAKNQYLLREGEIEKNVYFIVDGAVRIFLVTEHEEHTIRFAYKNSVFTSLNSFISGRPSEFYLQALRKPSVYCIPKAYFIQAVTATQESVTAYNEMLKDLIVQQMEREVDLLTHSPAERLKRVMERSPQLFQEIPSKYIASYLRMTPETLSRIRIS